MSEKNEHHELFRLFLEVKKRKNNGNNKSYFLAISGQEIKI